MMQVRGETVAVGHCEGVNPKQSPESLAYRGNCLAAARLTMTTILARIASLLRGSQ
jgi:hypothetical protein